MRPAAIAATAPRHASLPASDTDAAIRTASRASALLPAVATMPTESSSPAPHSCSPNGAARCSTEAGNASDAAPPPWPRPAWRK